MFKECELHHGDILDLLNNAILFTNRIYNLVIQLLV